jgi:ADP-ribose pyrophosphatase YjhB (NUDIX family)
MEPRPCGRSPELLIEAGRIFRSQDDAQGLQLQQENSTEMGQLSTPGGVVEPRRLL